MKFIPAQLATLFQDGASHRNIRFLLKFLGMLVGVIVFYSLLFHFIMQWEGREFSWVTGFYWTLTVMSTLGFGDITFTSDLGRLFSIVVLLTGIIFLLVMLPFTIIQFFYAPWLEAHSRSLAPRELPPATSGHVLIIGADPTALNLARKMRQYGHAYALLCPAVQSALALHDQGYAVVVGEHDDAETYRRLRAERAALVVALDSDVRNTSIAFTVREVSPHTPILGKVDQDESQDILTLAGCTHVFPFTSMLGQAIARRSLGGERRSGVIGRFSSLVVAESPVMGSRLEGKTLRQCGLRKAVGVNVVGFWERGRFSLPEPDLPLHSGMVLVIAGDEEQIRSYDAFAGAPAKNDAPVIILGGGRVGRAAAEQLLQQGQDYRVVEKAPGDGAAGAPVAGNAATWGAGAGGHPPGPGRAHHHPRQRLELVPDHLLPPPAAGHADHQPGHPGPQHRRAAQRRGRPGHLPRLAGGQHRGQSAEPGQGAHAERGHQHLPYARARGPGRQDPA
jgi:Trk K+ transport system NAD-binding subunit